MSERGILKPNFLAFFEQIPDLVCVSTKEGFFKFVNKAVGDVLGFSVAELRAVPISSFIFEEDQHLTSLRRAELFNGKPLVNFENRYVTKSGEIVWLYWTSIYMPDQNLVFGLAKDITEKKRLEFEVNEKYERFRNLVSHFKNSIEKDRKNFALELHEELAQLASVIKLNLNSVTNANPNLPARVSEPLEHAAFIAELMVNTIRKISFEISPYMLDGHPLEEILHMLCNKYTLLYEVSCELEIDIREESLTQEMKVDIFRICQEALKGMVHYSAPQLITVFLKETDELFDLTITDDGRGFDLTGVEEASCLQGIRERVASIEGKLTVGSEPGRGSTINVKVEK